MKLIIDIHKKDYQSILNSGQVPYGVVYAIINGILLPEDTTNGDVIKAIFKTMFPRFEVYENRDNEDYPYVDVIIGEHDSTCYPKNWWDEQYKRGDKDADSD